MELDRQGVRTKLGGERLSWERLQLDPVAAHGITSTEA
ncbi:hypothetical protein T1E_1372 [Pseudomonas putida DOT-T1E]|uniref:Uncharacterized protein n=1 Tax=Pseudomonas putida (strain DOT-T1E) TaxID=1196325 RepID=I7BSW6_PSEPT|nr:hypothetical protein T1E_1372 [Pseudomonas putida DOT-T1E]